MRSAIALYMTTFLFLVDDAVFFLSSVLIIDGGEVLAVQKFIWSLCLETSALKCWYSLGLDPVYFHLIFLHSVWK